MIHLSHDEFAASITPAGEGTGFVLRWTDYVANEWTEEYTTLPVAILRLGVLVACGDAGWRDSFVSMPDDFTQAAQAFIATQKDDTPRPRKD